MREAYNHGKAIAAAEEGADLLKALGITTAPGVVYEKKGGEPVGRIYRREDATSALEPAQIAMDSALHPES